MAALADDPGQEAEHIDGTALRHPCVLRPRHAPGPDAIESGTENTHAWLRPEAPGLSK